MPPIDRITPWWYSEGIKKVCTSGDFDYADSEIKHTKKKEDETERTCPSRHFFCFSCAFLRPNACGEIERGVFLCPKTGETGRVSPYGYRRIF